MPTRASSWGGGLVGDLLVLLYFITYRVHRDPLPTTPIESAWGTYACHLLHPRFDDFVAGYGRGTSQRVRSATQVEERLSEGNVDLVILDLEAPGLAVDAVVDSIKQSASEIRIVAFGPHVWTDQLAGAQQSGCDQVLSRGEFTRNLKDLLSSV